MTLEEFTGLVRTHVEAQFPKTCPMCAHVYRSLPEYLRRTRPVGKPISYDAELGDWEPSEPVGTFSLALCTCGTSIALDTSRVGLVTLWRMMHFARAETKRRGITLPEFLALIRVEIRNRVLGEGDGPSLPNPES